MSDYPAHDPTKPIGGCNGCGCRACMSAFFAEARLAVAAQRDRDIALRLEGEYKSRLKDQDKP